MIVREKGFHPNYRNRKILEICLSIIAGLLLGLLIVFDSFLPLSSEFQKLILVIPFVLIIVILFDNLEKLVLVVFALGVPLNLDVSLIVSPYAANTENIRKGLRTLITTTELRISIVTIALLIGYVLWLVSPGGTEHKPVRFYASTTIPALGFIFLSILSVIQATDKQLWFFRVEQLIEVFLVYFYLVNHIQTTHDMQFFMIVFLGGLLAESVLMIIQWITGLNFVFAGIEVSSMGPMRIEGTLGNTGPAAGYLSAMSIIAMAMIWGFQTKNQKRFAAITMVLSIIALISTGSRIGWVGFALTLMAFLLAGQKYGWIKPRALFLITMLAFLIGTSFFGIISERLSTLNDSSAQSRPMMWKLAWNIIQAHPWLGVGAGNYALMTRKYYTPDIGLESEVFDKIVHNAYLGVWAESGTFALLSYVGFLGLAFLSAWSCIRSHSKFVSRLGMGLALAIISLCIQMVTGTFHTRPITLFVWLLVALAASLPNLEKEKTVSLI